MDDEGSNWSPILNTVVIADNTSCGTPTLISGGTMVASRDAVLSAIVSASELRAASSTLEVRTKTGTGDFSSWTLVSQQNARPGVSVTVSDTRTFGTSGGNVEWRINALTSNGAVSSYLTLSESVPSGI